MSELLSTVQQTLQSVTATSQPWSTFLEPTSLSLPTSLSDTTTRVSHNLLHFLTNYILILILILIISLITHPLVLLAFVLLILAWFYLYLWRVDSFVFLGVEVNDRVVLVGLCLATVVVVIWSGVYGRVLGAVGVGVVLVGLHAVLRSTDDLVTTPYGDILEESDSPRGNYSGI